MPLTDRPKRLTAANPGQPAAAAPLSAQPWASPPPFGGELTAGRLMLRMTRGCRLWVILLGVMALAAAGAETVLPAALGHTVDAVLNSFTKPATHASVANGAADGAADGSGHARGPLGLSFLAGPAAWLTVLALLAAASVGCDAFIQLATGATAADATAWLRERLIRRVVFAGVPVTRSLTPGDTVSRVVGGAADAGGAPAGLTLAVTAAIPPVGAAVALALMNIWLAVALIAGFPVLALVLRAFVRDTSQTVERYQRAQGAIAGLLLDALQGARTIAASGTLTTEAARVLAPLPKLREHGDHTWRIQGRVAAQGTLLIPLLQVLVLTVGGLELAAGAISPGELLAASQYAVLGAGAGAAISHLNRVARARAGANRAAEILRVPVPTSGTRSLPPGGGRIEFRDVRVTANGELVIEDLNLLVPARTSVALVGRSGAGKSVIAALAGRLADPGEGEVLLDGVPLAELTRRELRRAVSYAFDRPALPGRTVAGAIRFGEPAAPEDRIHTAARRARADVFIERLPMGYETPLAQAPMSGGERQRLGLARAFASADGARVLILDDATSSLDTVTEMQISRALTGELGDRTRLLVAHRASTAARADLVAWIDRGRLRACAPHAQLWADAEYRAVFAAPQDAARTPAAAR